MSLDDLIRGALQGEAGGSAEPPPWGTVRARAIARRRRRRTVGYPLLSLVTVAAIAGSVIALASLRDGDGSGPGVTASPSSERPEQIVAATADGRLVVLASNDGRELRTIADGVDSQTSIAVTPDGERVFFDRPSTTGGPPREIATVPTTGGEVVVIAGEAGQPAVSPDGSKLAFVRYRPGPNGDWQARDLEVITTATALETPERLGYWESQAGSQLGYLSWAPDSQHLVYTLFTTSDGIYARVLDTHIETSLHAPERILNPDDTRIQGYLGSTSDFFGTRCPTSTSPDGVSVVTFDPSGTVERVLFPADEDCRGEPESDESGRHFLVVDLDQQTLYRWSEGDADPTKVAEGIVAAAWLPRAVESAPEEVAVPDVVGLDANAARQVVESAGFTVAIGYRTDGIEPGRVFDQVPRAGTKAIPGRDHVEFVVDMFESCGGFFAPTELPAGFDQTVRTGAAPEANQVDPLPDENHVIRHYTDDAGRSIEIRRSPPSDEPSDRFRDRDPDAYVLGQPVRVQPVDAAPGEPLVVQFAFPTGTSSNESIECSLYSIHGYGVTKEELAAFAGWLRPVP